MVMPDKDSLEGPVRRRSTSASRARYNLLGSILTNYGHGLIILAVAPFLYSLRHPPLWVTVCEVATSMVLYALTFLTSPKDER